MLKGSYILGALAMVCDHEALVLSFRSLTGIGEAKFHGLLQGT